MPCLNGVLSMVLTIKLPLHTPQHTMAVQQWLISPISVPLPKLRAKFPMNFEVASLSHFHEIRCCAFALIQTNNPKIYCHSTPCTQIGFALHSKVYRLWDNVSGKVFNSFHVNFIEHLDAQLVKSFQK